MRKQLFVSLFALLLLWATSALGSAPANQTPAANTNHAASDNKKLHQNSLPAPSPQSGRGAADHPPNNSPDMPKGAENERTVRIASVPPISIKWSIADTIALICTIALALVGILGVIVAVFTLRVIARQTSATEEAAQAARVSAEAFITESRPWLLLHKDMSPEGPHPYWQFLIRIHNFGKTPGKVIALQIEMKMGASKDAPPSPEFFGSEKSFNAFVLPQGESITQELDLTGAEGINDVPTGRKHLWLCGLVKYQNTFESPRPTIYETLFCLRYDPATRGRRDWRRGPDNYNKAT